MPFDCPDVLLPLKDRPYDPEAAAASVSDTPLAGVLIVTLPAGANSTLVVPAAAVPILTDAPALTMHKSPFAESLNSVLLPSTPTRASATPACWKLTIERLALVAAPSIATAISAPVKDNPVAP